MNTNKQINGLSLFSNVGIAETYIHNKINIVVANELLEIRSNFYKEMYHNTNMINGDITNELIFNKVIEKSIENNCEFLIATPPCQGMSVAGKMSENDIRNTLIIKVIQAIKLIKPKYFLIENVVAMPNTFILINNKKILIKDYIYNELSNDYNININILNTMHYGTPQSRKRCIILGTLNSLKEWKVPNIYNYIITVDNAISYLPSLEHNQDSNIPFHYAKKHNENHVLWMKNTPTGQSALLNKIHFPKKENGDKIKGFLTTYKRIEWNKPAPTITMANGSISSQNNVHPGRLNEDGTYSDARVLTLKEIFILTGLPDDWTPPNWASENLIRQVIGEGVPPKLIEALINNLDIN